MLRVRLNYWRGKGMKLQYVYDVVPVMIWTKKGRRYEAEIKSVTSKEGAELYVKHINNDGTDRYAEIMKSEKVFRVEGLGNERQTT